MTRKQCVEIKSKEDSLQNIKNYLKHKNQVFRIFLKLKCKLQNQKYLKLTFINHLTLIYHVL